jgi:hypothetical protein
MGRGIAESSM